MSRRVTLGLLLAILGALALRCPQLAWRPMHTDEAVNAITFRKLWNNGIYRYDPDEHHGPTLFYATLLWTKLTGEPDFAHIDAARYRLVTVIFGVALIALLPLVADGLGRNATICAAALTAISPAMVFYSRYFIHEMPLVFFTLLMLAAGWRYTRSHKMGWAALAGAAAGLMQATKETFVLTLAAIAVAWALNALWSRRADADAKQKSVFNPKRAYPHTAHDGHDIGLPTPHPGPLPVEGRGCPNAGATNPLTHLGAVSRYAHPKHIAVAIVAWLAVVVVLFSSFFTNAEGPLDAIRTYLPWSHRAAGDSPHIHSWYFYLVRLAWFHRPGGPVWSEGLILALAAAGIIAAFARKGLPEANAGFVRFLAFYSVTLAVIYSAIAYKTPWCLLSFWDGLILLAGVGAVAAFNWAQQRGAKIVLGIALAVCAAQLAGQALGASTTYAANPANPYVYAQTSPDILKLVAEVNALAGASPQGRQTVVKVMAPDSDYWPLPWYLREFDHAGWWDKIPSDPYAPVMIVSTKFDAKLDEQKTHVMAGMFELRPQVFFELYVRLDLWRAYLGATKSKPAED